MYGLNGLRDKITALFQSLSAAALGAGFIAFLSETLAFNFAEPSRGDLRCVAVDGPTS